MTLVIFQLMQIYLEFRVQFALNYFVTEILI